MEIARSYYFHKKSRLDIAAEMGLSRFQVARLLNEAWDRGVVRVTLHRPRTKWTSLEVKLKEKYGLQHVSVVSPPSGSQQSIRQEIGREGALLLQQHVIREDVLGIGWGRTVKSVADNVSSLPTCQVVQLGGISGNPGENLIDLVGTFAKITGQLAHPLYAPLVVPNAATAASLRESPEMRETFRWFPKISVAVVAVGSWDPPNSQLRIQLSPKEQADLVEAGVVAEVCGVLLDRDGEEVKHPIVERIISLNATDLRRIPTVIAVAGHTSKAEAIHAVLTGRFVNMLVTDSAVARLLTTM